MSDVEFAIVVEKGLFNVFLNYVVIGLLHLKQQLLQFIKTLKHPNAATHAHTYGLEEPHILFTVFPGHALLSIIPFLDLFKSLSELCHLAVVLLDDEGCGGNVEHTYL